MADLLAAVVSALVFLAVPYVLYLLQVWVAAHVKGAAERRWAEGALSFAGQTYVSLIAARASNPATPLIELLRPVIAANTERFLRNYQQTADTLGANAIDAQTRLTGALGPMLAADPTVTVVPVVVARVAV